MTSYQLVSGMDSRSNARLVYFHFVAKQPLAYMTYPDEDGLLD